MKCPKCGTPIKLESEQLFMPGLSPKEAECKYVCPNCSGIYYQIHNIETHKPTGSLTTQSRCS